MSIIFGIRKSLGHRTEREELLTLGCATARFAPDGLFVHANGCIGMGFQPHHTTERSHLEAQPAVDRHGNIAVFDGRLDNHADLCRALSIKEQPSADSSIVLAAFEKWGEGCFSQFIGDWAIALWSSADQVLYLARDHAGTRTLYFEDANGTLRWSTYLETFFAVGEQYSLSEEYAARFLCGQPVHNLTPYQNICAISPAHYLVVRDRKITEKSHWEWTKRELIHYKSDGEYEEHFFGLFRQSVGRRTEALTPMTAQLSGGMDSTAIVCMSDHLRKSQGATSTELVDTMSFYDDTEASWDEKPYFSITEARRGKIGAHIDTSFTERCFQPVDSSLACLLLPGLDRAALDHEMKVQRVCADRGHRVILSGIGGDEVLGGVPSPTPELADYLVSANFSQLFQKGIQWSIATRMPLLHTLYGTAKYVGGLYLPQSAARSAMKCGLSPRLNNLSLQLKRQDAPPGQRFAARPSAVGSGRAWWSVVETPPHLLPGILVRYEYRYPYLDRDLIDFLFRIPREQLVRPGRRRSLMRRSLKQLVPVEILERRRKAFISRSPIVAIQRIHGTLESLFANPLIVKYGLVDHAALHTSLERVTSGMEIMSWPALARKAAFEIWLRSNLARLGLSHRRPS